jgi:hypothetical protein
MKNIDDVYVNFWGKPKQPLPVFTETELALMEGGHCLEEPVKIKMSFLKSLTEHSLKRIN